MTEYSTMTGVSAVSGGAWIILAALAAAFAVQPSRESRAATFPDLYTVIVTPPPNAGNVNQAAQRLAMEQLLTRLTGRRDAALAPELAHLVGNAQEWRVSLELLERGRIGVGFTSEIVNELTRAGWPVWEAERPLTLLWVAVDFGDGNRALVGASPAAAGLTPEFAEFMRSLREELDAVAYERGLPVTYPLLDVQDLATISFAEVWGGFDGLISAASQRYEADAVLVGRVAVGPLGLDVRWSLLEDGRSRAVFGTDVRGGLDWLADQYAAEYSIVGGARNARIAVLDVTSLEDYGRVMSHLESLSVLQSVDVESFDGSTLNLRIAVRGDDRLVERLLTLGGVLIPSRDFAVSAVSLDSLVFRIAGTRARR